MSYVGAEDADLPLLSNYPPILLTVASLECSRTSVFKLSVKL
jgi:hypothetical protein